MGTSDSGNYWPDYLVRDEKVISFSVKMKCRYTELTGIFYSAYFKSLTW